jgi:DNA-binding MarR family transcriptional regulator
VKSLLQQFNLVLENRVRLAVMSALVVNEKIEFNSLKEMLGLTDGNLASHIATLEKSGYLSIKKKFLGKKPQTTYAATAAGRKAFAEHLAALEHFLTSHRQSA